MEHQGQRVHREEPQMMLAAFVLGTVRLVVPLILRGTNKKHDYLFCVNELVYITYSEKKDSRLPEFLK